MVFSTGSGKDDSFFLPLSAGDPTTGQPWIDQVHKNGEQVVFVWARQLPPPSEQEMERACKPLPVGEAAPLLFNNQTFKLTLKCGAPAGSG